MRSFTGKSSLQGHGYNGRVVRFLSESPELADQLVLQKAPPAGAKVKMNCTQRLPTTSGKKLVEYQAMSKMGVQICYEIIFSGRVVDQTHRPSFLFNPSNDAWFGSWGPPQHLAQARMRAIEEGLPVLRSTTTGISAVIDAHSAFVKGVFELGGSLAGGEALSGGSACRPKYVVVTRA